MGESVGAAYHDAVGPNRGRGKVRRKGKGEEVREKGADSLDAGSDIEYMVHRVPPLAGFKQKTLRHSGTKD